MGIFSKAEIVVLKESNSAKEYLEKLEALLPRAKGKVKDKIEREIAITKAGIAGEENVLFELKNSNINMYILQDVYIETKDGRSAQIDFVVVTQKLTFLIECKNLVGDIEIDSRGNFTRTIQYGKRKYREGFYSPITQNERHMEILKECIAEQKGTILGSLARKGFNMYHRSLVVLANSKAVLNDRFAKKEVKEKVIRVDQLITTMKKILSEESFWSKSSKQEIQGSAERLLQKNKIERPDYISKYEELIKEMEESQKKEAEVSEKKKKENVQVPGQKAKLICPRCGAELVLRTARRGASIGKQFYGCSSFPTCRFVMNIEK